MKAISQVLWIALLGVALVSSYPIDNHPQTDLEDLLLLARLEKESEEFNNDIDGSSEEVIRNPSTILLPPPVPEDKKPTVEAVVEIPSEPVQPIIPETITEVNPPSTDGVQIDDEMNTPDVLILIATPASVIISEDPELNPSTDAVLLDDKEPPKAEILIYTLPSGLASEESTTLNPDGSANDDEVLATTDKASGISEDEETLATTPLPDLSVPSVISSDPKVLADPAVGAVVNEVPSATEKEEILISTPQPENDDGLSSDTTEKGSGAEDDTLHHEEGPSAVLNNLANDAEESHSTPLIHDPDVPEGTTLLPTADDLTADDEHHTESSATDGSPIVQQDETTEVSITDPTTKEPTVAPPSASHHTTKEPTY